MRALLDRIKGFAERGAGLLGVGAVAFALLSGLTLGSLPSAGLSFLIGKAAGYRAAGRQAEINRLARDAAEARVDANAARAAEQAARAGEARNASAQAASEKRNVEYAKALRSLGPMGACGLSDADIGRLRDNASAVQRGARRPRPPASR